ncbi:VOC family protein [Methylobacterium sp. A54F]
MTTIPTTIQVTTHLNFRGQAREALDFYQSVFGGDLTIVTYADLGAVQDPAQAGQVIWGQVASDRGFHVMAYDVQSDRSWSPGENAFYVSVRGSAPDEIAAYWERLSAGATILQPLGPSGWSPVYGMLRDRLGVTWVLDVAAEPAGG